MFLAAVIVVGLAACSGNSAAGAGGGSGAKSGGGSGTTSSGSSASFSGSESGKVVMNLCTDSGDDSIFVTVNGSSDKLPGEVSKDNLGFNGSDSIYTIDKTGPMPQVSTDGNTITLDGVKVKSALDPSKVLTFSGKITCP
jgi:hypothetical protein